MFLPVISSGKRPWPFLKVHSNGQSSSFVQYDAVLRPKVIQAVDSNVSKNGDKQYLLLIYRVVVKPFIATQNKLPLWTKYDLCTVRINFVVVVTIRGIQCFTNWMISTVQVCSGYSKMSYQTYFKSFNFTPIVRRENCSILIRARFQIGEAKPTDVTDRRSNFFFSPPAHLCAVTYMTEISLIVTLNN